MYRDGRACNGSFFQISNELFRIGELFWVREILRCNLTVGDSES